MDSDELSLAGYASIVAAAASIPMTIYSMLNGFSSEPSTIIKALDLLYMVLLVFVSIKLIDYLSDKDFTDANNLLWTSIGLSIILYFINMISPDDGDLLVLVIPLGVILGVVTILIGIKLKNCPNSLHGYLKTFSNLTIATGICGASILLLPFALIFQMVALVIQGMIFLKEADKVKSVF